MDNIVSIPSPALKKMQDRLEAQEDLLKQCLQAFNELPRVTIGEDIDTYTLAQRINYLLKT